MTTVDWPALDHALRARRRGILERFVECLRVDTVSQQPARVRAGADWLARAMEGRGLAARVLETGGNPVVFGERRVPGASRTLLIYCHFDTKPAPPAGWIQPSPFEPVLRAGLAEEGAPIVAADEVPDDALPAHRLYARGASDDKGPIWAHLEALALMDTLGFAPRVNVKLVLEGEEEVGSPGFGGFVAAHRDLLAADLVLVTDGPKDASERPTVVFGARGILALTLELEVARRDVHSGNFSVPNPAWVLTGLLASMAAPDGTPLIEGLGADVTPPTAIERELLGRIPLDRPALDANNRQHSPNEHIRLDHLYQGVRTTARLLRELGD